MELPKHVLNILCPTSSAIPYLIKSKVVTEYCGATCICDADSGHQVVTEYCGATCICDVVGSALLLSGVVHFYPHL